MNVSMNLVPGLSVLVLNFLDHYTFKNFILMYK